MLRWNGEEWIFEVKEREACEAPADGHHDPYAGIRQAINKAKKKFKEFKDHCCCLIVANEGDPSTLLHPEFIFAAMLGDLGFTFSILDTNEGHQSQTSENVFLPKRGKMVDYKRSEYENTTIAAIIVLEEVSLRNTRFERLQQQTIDEKERKREHQLSSKERAVLGWQLATEYVEAGRGPIYHRAPRVIVCENPGAQRPLPREMFCGPFDERWAIVDGYLSPVYAGIRVREIEDPPVGDDVYLRPNGRAQACVEN